MVLLPGHPELPLHLRHLEHHRPMSSLLKRATTLLTEMGMVPKTE